MSALKLKKKTTAIVKFFSPSAPDMPVQAAPAGSRVVFLGERASPERIRASLQTALASSSSGR